jgi:hypothetical protein
MRKSLSVKIKYLIIFLIALVLLIISRFLIINHFSQNIKSAYNNEVEENFYHLYINPQTSEIEKIIFEENGKITGVKQITNNNYSKSHLLLYANEGPMFGYYQDLHRYDEDFDYNNDEARNNYYNNYIALMIDRGDGSDPFLVYKGEVHTSNWEWEDNEHVKVYLGCGTHCLYYYIINIYDLKIKEKGHVYND